jgi:hypothetical protein
MFSESRTRTGRTHRKSIALRTMSAIVISTFADEHQHDPDQPQVDRKVEAEHVEQSSVTANQDNLAYADEEEEPELHARTYLAIAALFVLNFVQVFALTGPPAIVSSGHLLADPWAHRSAYLYWRRLGWILYPKLGPQRPVPSSSCGRTSHRKRSHAFNSMAARCRRFNEHQGSRFSVIRLRHIPSPEDSPNRHLYRLVHRRCHRPGLKQYLPCHRCPDPHRFRLCGGASGLCHSFRGVFRHGDAHKPALIAKCSDPAPQMETKCVPTLMSMHPPSLLTAKSRPILDECRSCRRGHHGTFVRPFRGYALK